MAVEKGFEKFFRFFYKVRFFILGLWVIILGVGGYFGIKFLSSTSFKHLPPSNTQSERDYNYINELYTARSEEGQLVIFLGTSDAHSKHDILDVNSSCKSIDYKPWAVHATEVVVNAALEINGSSGEHKGFVLQLVGRYFPFNETVVEADPMLKQFLDTGFLGPNKTNPRSTIMTITLKENENRKSLRFLDKFRDKIDDHLHTCGGRFEFYLIGMDTMLEDMSSAAIGDLRIMDTVALPIALGVLIFVVQALTVMLIPIIAVVGAIALSFGIMYILTIYYHVPTYSPAVMMSLIISMSIDYSLFILTRYHEEIMHGHKNFDAVMNSLRYSGQTILASGIILCISLTAMLFFPVQVVALIGASALIALASAQVSSLMLTPTVMLIGSRLFSIPGVIPCIKKCRKIEKKTKVQLHEEEVKGLWFRITSFTTRSPHCFIVIAVILIVLAPFCVGNYYLYTVAGVSQALPRNSRTTDSFDRFGDEWPMGLLNPFEIVAVPTYLVPSDFYGDSGDSGMPDVNMDQITDGSSSSAPKAKIFSEEFFNVSHGLLHELVRKGVVSSEAIVSISYLGNRNISFAEAVNLTEMGEPAYYFLLKWLNNPEGTATRMTVPTAFDPTLDTSNVTAFFRPILKKWTHHSNFTFILSGDLVTQADSSDAALDNLPLILSISLGLIAISVIVAFRAPFVPVRMIATIAITVAWTYGVISLIFCSGWFDFIHELKKEPGLDWVVPILSIFLCVGLALDYDIFLYTRIREFRLLGWSNRASVVKGTARTGRVITFAGIIMAIAYSGLAASSLLLLDQFALVILFSVLLDTFVIRTSLNPALMFICGPLNYGCHMPPVKYEDPSEFHPEAETGDDGFDDDKPTEEPMIDTASHRTPGTSEVEQPLLG